MIFGIENWLWKSKILALFDSSPLIQNSKFNHFLRVYWFLGKNLSYFVPPLENSTTRTTYHILHVPIRKRYYKTLNVKKWLHIYFLIHFFVLSSIDWKVFYDKFKNSQKTKTMDYVRHVKIHGRSLVFFEAHCPCILPSLTCSIRWIRESYNKNINT